MKFGVVVFPGTTCDDDLVYTLSSILHQDVVRIWHKERDLQGSDFVILPGGFSRSENRKDGLIDRNSPVMEEVAAHALKGGYVMGISNGFRTLCEAGLLPGALVGNNSRRFICRNVYIKATSANSPLTSGIERDKALRIPIAHAEGNYSLSADELKKIESNDQVLFRYCDAAGNVHEDANPNGSVRQIAGVCNAGRNVFGLMPHPERASDYELEGTDGREIFDSILAAIHKAS